MNIGNLSKKELGLILLDLVMMLILLLNLFLILFDLIFSSEIVQEFFKTYTYGFYQFYNDKIHKNFVLIDLVFVTIFLSEFTIRWVIAIYRQTYAKWFFFPFIYWYDLIGSLPVGSLRLLRIFRIISIVYRLQRLRIVDLTRTYIAGLIRKYTDVLMEEVSDRVVVNVLRGVQDEVKEGNPVSEKIINNVVLPQKHVLVEWLSHRIQKAISNSYPVYRDDIKTYVDSLIQEAVDKNKEIKTLEKIPVVGSALSSTLESVIRDIVFNVTNSMIQDLASSQNREFIDESVDILVGTLISKEEDKALNRVVVDITDQSLEIIIQQVQVKQWLLKEQKQKELRRRAKAIRKASSS